MRDLLRYLLADTVERHVSPARYRIEKVAHVTLLGCLGVLAGLEPAMAFLLASLGYWLGGMVLASRAGSRLWTWDKVRDLWLVATPFYVVTEHWWFVAASLAVNVALVRVRD